MEPTVPSAAPAVASVTRPLLVLAACAFPGALSRPEAAPAHDRQVGYLDAITSEFARACQGARSPWRSNFWRGLCFPRVGVLTAALNEAYATEPTERFMTFLQQYVVERLMDWAPGWAAVVKILDAKQPWMPAYCDDVLGDPSSVTKFMRRTVSAPRSTFGEMRAHHPKLAEVLDRWLGKLRASKDKVVVRLVEAVEAADMESGFWRTRPFDQLLNHLHARPAKHLLTRACKTSRRASKAFYTGGPEGGWLSFAAGQGDTRLVEVILGAVPEAERDRLVDAVDGQGYDAMAWAKLGHFEDTVQVIQRFGGGRGSRTRAMLEPLGLFPPTRTAVDRHASACSVEDGAAAACSATSTSGGWRPDAGGLVPADWLPPAGGSQCSVEVIHADQFDWEIFFLHYVFHRRPLLIRGGARLPPRAARSYTRKGLLVAAGDVVIEAQRVPYGASLVGETPLNMSLREYVAYLDARLTGQPVEALHYVFVSSLRASWRRELDFARELPELLAGIPAGSFRFGAVQFYVGGALMGSPLHYHTNAANSLAHGRKLWLLRPPADTGWSNMPIYEYLAGSGGDPSSLRCMQEAGDLFYVPGGWVHGAICLGDCVGVAHEFELGG